MLRVFIFTLATAMFFTLASCGEPPITPEQARQELEKRNVPFEPEQFVHRAKRAHERYVDLFLAGGMDPNVTDEDGIPGLWYASEVGPAGSVQAMYAEGDVRAEQIVAQLGPVRRHHDGIAVQLVGQPHDLVIDRTMRHMGLGLDPLRHVA